jgi:hypothetical protein
MIMLAYSMAFGIGNAVFALSQAVGYTVIADEGGVSWRKGILRPRWIHVSWDSIRVSGRFARLDVTRNKWEHDSYAYLLDIGDALLTWGVNPFLSAAGGVYTPKDAQAEWEQFAAFITARSGLPLRDITPVALAIARATGGRVRERKIAEMLLAHHRASEHVTISGLQRAVALVAEQENPQRRNLLRTLSWIPLALFVALYLVGAIVQLRG